MTFSRIIAFALLTHCAYVSSYVSGFKRFTAEENQSSYDTMRDIKRRVVGDASHRHLQTDICVLETEACYADTDCNYCITSIDETKFSEMTGLLPLASCSYLLYAYEYAMPVECETYTEGMLNSILECYIDATSVVECTTGPCEAEFLDCFEDNRCNDCFMTADFAAIDFEYMMTMENVTSQSNFTCSDAISIFQSGFDATNCDIESSVVAESLAMCLINESNETDVCSDYTPVPTPMVTTVIPTLATTTPMPTMTSTTPMPTMTSTTPMPTMMSTTPVPMTPAPMAYQTCQEIAYICMLDPNCIACAVHVDPEAIKDAVADAFMNGFGQEITCESVLNVLKKGFTETCNYQYGYLVDAMASCLLKEFLDMDVC